MSKFTEGLWTINDWKQGDAEIRVGAAGTPCIATAHLRDVSINEQIANAKLIAAAPEMLAALQAVMQWASEPGDHGGNPYCKKFVQLAEKAIAKAQGDSKGE